MRASRGQGEAETWLCGVQAAGACGKGNRNTKRGEMGGEKQWRQETQGKMGWERDEIQTGQRKGGQKSPEAAQGGHGKGRDKEGRLEQLRPATP